MTDGYPFYPYIGWRTKTIKEPVAGDSGFGRAVAVAYAKEGADLAIVYLNEHRDAAETKQYVEQFGVRCLLLPRDLRGPATAPDIVTGQVVHVNGGLIRYS